MTRVISVSVSPEELRSLVNAPADARITIKDPYEDYSTITDPHFITISWEEEVCDGEGEG